MSYDIDPERIFAALGMHRGRRFLRAARDIALLALGALLGVLLGAALTFSPILALAALSAVYGVSTP